MTRSVFTELEHGTIKSPPWPRGAADNTSCVCLPRALTSDLSLSLGEFSVKSSSGRWWVFSVLVMITHTWVSRDPAILAPACDDECVMSPVRRRPIRGEIWDPATNQRRDLGPSDQSEASMMSVWWLPGMMSGVHISGSQWLTSTIRGVHYTLHSILTFWWTFSFLIVIVLNFILLKPMWHVSHSWP